MVLEGSQSCFHGKKRRIGPVSGKRIKKSCTYPISIHTVVSIHCLCIIILTLLCVCIFVNAILKPKKFTHWIGITIYVYCWSRMGILKILFCCHGASSNEVVVKQKSSKWRIFSFNELSEATNNFSHGNMLGQGGFGTVYYGKLLDGSQIAVKRLKVWTSKAEMEFAVEVEILGRLKHKNLLSLCGYCAEDQERLIVYEYMRNSSLHAHLHGKYARQSPLDWSKRMNIAIGSAEGLEYLHHHVKPHIIHRDVKASNVLLDSDFQARVSDFGFARLIPDGVTHVTTRVKGTLGYLAPEYAMWGKASKSCDLYSFGILLLELVSGKKPIETLGSATKSTLADWAASLVSEGRFEKLADRKLQGSYNREELERIVLVAIACAQTEPGRRPNMHDVVNFLKSGSKETILKTMEDRRKGTMKLDVVKHGQKLLESDGSSGSNSASALTGDGPKDKSIVNLGYVETP